MAKKALLTVDGTYHKVKKGFLTTDGTYRKIKKAFLTVGGVYRPCWSGGELAYYGTITSLNSSLAHGTGVSFNKCALIGAGWFNDDEDTSSYIDRYDSSLTLAANRLQLSSSETDPCSTAIKNHAIFYASKALDAFDASFTKTALGGIAGQRKNASSGFAGNSLAIFVGGESSYGYYYGDIISVTDALTKTQSTGIDTAMRCRGAGSGTSSMAIFGGGYIADTSSVTASVFGVDNALTTIMAATGLRTACSRLSSCTLNDKVIFAGGLLADNYETVGYVSCYDKSLTRTNLANLSSKRCAMPGVSHEGYALFAGGATHWDTNASAVCDIYDSSFVRTVGPSLQQKRVYHSAGVAGDYIIVAGGRISSSSITRSAEAYAVI